MHCRVAVSSVRWIDSDAALHNAVLGWGDTLALDTEFIRTNTFFPAPGLYQVASGDDVYLIDPLPIEDWQPFVNVLADPRVTKVMHACQEDLELLYHHLGVHPEGLFDTQFAHAFLSADYSLSYARLVDVRLGVSLDKHETRSNWLARPLTEQQIAYAVEDVVYLVPLYEDLSRDLAAVGRHDWFLEDMVERGTYQPVDPQAYYRNLKKAWQLPPRQLAALQVLCAWREKRAVQENVPRNRVVWDDHLFAFARRERLTAGDIYGAVPRVVAKRYADALLAEHARSAELAQAPEPLPPPLTSRQGAIVKTLKASGNRAAEQHGLAPELVSRKKELEECVRHFVATRELAPRFRSWRQNLVGDEYLRIMLDTWSEAPPEQTS